jgi:hypothetical protein
LSKYYNGANGFNEEDVNDPRMDFCNAFWGPGEKGYEVLMARLRGANRTVEELRAFWKERIAIEEDYAKRLAKLSKVTLGKDEIGDLQGSLQNLLMETAQQATYHQSLSTELRQSVESPTAEFGNRLVNLKKGLQASIEKSYKNKGLQEGHVQKVSVSSHPLRLELIIDTVGQRAVRVGLPKAQLVHCQQLAGTR